MIAWALDICFAAVTLAFLITGWRVVRGPELTDRVLAIDTLYINTVALVILLGLRLGSDLLFEAALIIAMLGFVGTVALARYLARGDVIE
ncbi:K+/H+ antiporter subunit F [Piscinibacter sp.]|uniref:K+/H+ antiporter subunit F n=1 Tax=Piscinibacter sp. TaxID=1903157 RepID=UPI002B6550B0|nr:K+/H+ antiporter subunit F [Albitalea sp.]HUG23308.1 K+/H+ antiporter subunit F [Albitalea sp.]